MRGATRVLVRHRLHGQDFNPRTPCGVRPLPRAGRPTASGISIHAPLAGCDFYHPQPEPNRGHFNPRTPCGVRRVQNANLIVTRISIHAPLAGCDAARRMASSALRLFQSTHPLRGATPHWLVQPPPLSLFQSTHPVRGATPSHPCPFRAQKHFNPRTPCGVRRTRPCCATTWTNFNPRTPCGVRQCCPPVILGSLVISIHAPLAGCDCSPFTSEISWPISIHAPLAGCDVGLTQLLLDRLYFNPRTPCGVRLLCLFILDEYLTFQSTHPLRGATAKTYKENCTFFELADKLSARIAAKKPSAKADRCA